MFLRLMRAHWFCIIMISYLVFFLCTSIICKFFQRPQIAQARRARAILLVVLIYSKSHSKSCDYLYLHATHPVIFRQAYFHSGMLFMVQYFKRKHLGFIFEYARYKLELLVMLHSISLFKLCILTHLLRKKKLFFLFSVFAHQVIPQSFCSMILESFYLPCTKLLSTLKVHSKVFHQNNLK